MKIKRSKGERLFHLLIGIFLALLCLITIYPFWHVIMYSLSDSREAMTGGLFFWPRSFTLLGYETLFKTGQIFVAYRNSLLQTAVGVCLSLLLTVLTAFPLSLQRFRGRKIFTLLIFLTMLFNGGMIPTYLVVKGTGLIDTIWALVVPGSVSVFNLILMMNYFKSLPDALQEAAYIDGAGHITTLVKIVLPLSMPALASISLFVIMGHWNEYFTGMIYIRDPDLKPLQTYLRSIIIVAPTADDAANVESLEQNLTPDATNGAKIFLGLLPIMTLYPFLQKHFAKGIIRGSVKE